MPCLRTKWQAASNCGRLHDLRRFTSSSWPYRGRSWHSHGMTLHTPTFSCRQGTFRKPLHIRHSTLRSIPLLTQTVRYDAHTELRKACSNRRNRRKGSCTLHVPSSPRRQVCRSDGNNHRTGVGSPHKSSRTSSCGQRAGCRLLG